MAQVRIVTDSTSDLPADIALPLDITVVPCQLFWERKTYRDGLDFTPEAFYHKLARSRELPNTSQPAVSSFVDAYEGLLEEEGTEGIVSIHVAGTLSGTMNAAWAATQSLTRPDRVSVVDSGQVSMSLGWAAVEAARMARAGAHQVEIAEAVRALVPRLHTVAMIDTLDNLRKGGRVSHVSALLGTALQIKPLVMLHNGQLDVWSRVRTRSKALLALAERVRSWGRLKEAAVLHSGSEELAEELVRLLRDVFANRPPEVLPAGSALTSHLGLGAVGVCALQGGKEPTWGAASPGREGAEKGTRMEE